VSNPELEAKIEAWVKTEPPEGEGWQVWETVSEGSPVSPVFATADDLVRWLIHEGGYSYDAARSFVQQKWVPSMVAVNGVLAPDIHGLDLS
jgi:hypothetical protein